MCGNTIHESLPQDRIPNKGLRERPGCDGMGMYCKKNTMIGWRNVWSMKVRVLGQEIEENVDRDCGKRLSGR